MSRPPFIQRIFKAHRVISMTQNKTYMFVLWYSNVSECKEKNIKTPSRVLNLRGSKDGAVTSSGALWVIRKPPELQTTEAYCSQKSCVTRNWTLILIFNQVKLRLINYINLNVIHLVLALNVG